jgi:Leucine-rich repeat (LRR) protein
MSSHCKRVTRPWRRYLRFSMRTFIVVVLLVGGWLGWIVRTARIQRDEVAAITRAGGIVEYDSGWTDNQTLQPQESGALDRLVNAIGVDYFSNATVVYVGMLCTEEKMSHVTKLTALRSLSLRTTRPANGALAHLNGLTKLSELDLGFATICDADLAHLEGLGNLSKLDLGVTDVTDAGLIHLKGLTNLSYLNLTSTHITDKGLIHLRGLKNLSTLDLGGTLVTDAGLIHLKGLTNLTALDLIGNAVTDSGIKELKQAHPRLTIRRSLRLPADPLEFLPVLYW